jgi:hypothetical protein
MTTKTKTQTRWTKTRRNPDKVIAEVRRACRDCDYELVERQRGSSHWVGKVNSRDGETKGTLVIPRHGELKKGTWASIFRVITQIGLAALVLTVIGLLVL